EYCYQFTDEFGCTQEGLVILEHISKDAEVYIPNAFTPNNDGINDVFQPAAADVRDYRLTIWNRWGNLVFETENTEDFWDGSNNGSDHYAQNEVYTYRVEYNGTCNAEKILVTGNVLLMR
ncbi:MAG: gliding motility-associated-like protein, partial [Flavobacteriales bacterium]